MRALTSLQIISNQVQKVCVDPSDSFTIIVQLVALLEKQSVMHSIGLLVLIQSSADSQKGAKQANISQQAQQGWKVISSFVYPSSHLRPTKYLVICLAIKPQSGI